MLRLDCSFNSEVNNQYTIISMGTEVYLHIVKKFYCWYFYKELKK
ncbi:hypothetical protein [Tissierella praeacuta]|nr:hypothetical protein [Tissierella praeacuta]